MKNERVLVSTLRAVAAERGIEFQSLSYDWIIRLRRDDVVRWVFGYDFDINPCCAQQLAKDKAGASLVLELAGVPRVEHVLFNHPQNAGFVPAAGTWPAIVEYALRHDFDVVLKPNDGSGGREVTRATNVTELEEAAMKLFAKVRAIALSPFHEIAHEYRLVCLQGRCLVAYRKVRPVLIGDGRSTRLDLIAKQPDASGDGPAMSKSLAELGRQKLDLSVVVPAGEPWNINWKHNLGLGARVELLDASFPRMAELQQLAQSAMSALNLQFASVDVAEIAADASFKILEVNAGVMMESFATLIPQGRAIAEHVYRSAVDAMFTI